MHHWEYECDITITTHVDASLQSVAYDTIQLQIPPSPLPGDGSGSACVSAIVNGIGSECLTYDYVVPGKPIIEFTWTGCGSGSIVAYIYDASGSPVQGSVTFSAAYNAFQGPTGSCTNNLTVPTGQNVNIMIRGPITATNAQSPQLSTTQDFPDPPLRLCGNAWVTKGSIDPRLGPWLLGMLKPIALPPCPINECPDPLRDKLVGWTLPDDVALGHPYVTIAGGSPEALANEFTVRTLSSSELREYALANPYVALLGKPGKELAQFDGATVSVARKGHPADRVDKLDGMCQISFALPKGTKQPGEYRILHLMDNGKTRMWVEEDPAKLDADKSALLLNVNETGIYALVRLAASTKP